MRHASSRFISSRKYDEAENAADSHMHASKENIFFRPFILLNVAGTSFRLNTVQVCANLSMMALSLEIYAFDAGVRV